MSPEDRKWLEEALKQYTFNDAERLKEICDELKNHNDLDKDKVLTLLDELSELVELHPRNNYNLCLCGGMPILLDIIYNNQDDEIRRTAAPVFTMAV